MYEFLNAALPWIAIGIALAVISVNGIIQGKKHRNAKSETENKAEADDSGNYMTEGMCIGMCLGVVLGTTGAVDLGIGISIGMTLGMTVGLIIKKHGT